MEGDIAVNTDGDTLLEGGAPGQKRNKDHPQLCKDNSEAYTLWLTHAGPDNEVEPGEQGIKVFPYVFV